MRSPDNRLEAIRLHVERNPDQPFPRYGLAMEYAKQGHDDQALDEFAILRRSHPDYLPAYYQHGVVLARAGRAGEARRAFEAGIEVSKACGDEHTRSELEAALETLGVPGGETGGG